MLKPLTENQKSLIVSNILKAVKDINQLNKTGYNFLSNCGGFIAHYNLEGFKDYYDFNDLREDIIKYSFSNHYKNFREGDNNYQYYKSKADTYNLILSKII